MDKSHTTLIWQHLDFMEGKLFKVINAHTHTPTPCLGMLKHCWKKMKQEGCRSSPRQQTSRAGFNGQTVISEPCSLFCWPLSCQNYCVQYIGEKTNKPKPQHSGKEFTSLLEEYRLYILYPNTECRCHYRHIQGLVSEEPFCKRNNLCVQKLTVKIHQVECDPVVHPECSELLCKAWAVLS